MKQAYNFSRLKGENKLTQSNYSNILSRIEELVLKDDMKWYARFMHIAYAVSKWSKDSTQIGAIAVNKDRQIISTGYNGFPKQIKDDDRLKNRELKHLLTIHAEMNVIFNAYSNLRGCSVYVFGLPTCTECAKSLIQVGIKEIVLDKDRVFSCHEPWSTEWHKAYEMFIESGVKVVTI